MKNDTPVKILAENRKARHEYFVEDVLECGISLVGTEVKSMKSNQFSFNDAYAEIVEGELWVKNLHINIYKMAAQENHEPERKKRLLAHREEIKKLLRKVDLKGFTLIPIRFYLKQGLVKVEIGLCKGKKLYDKRATLKENDLKRDTARELRD